jgi:CRP/FNR family nitrogen fixation transcriptional regulator
MHTQPLTPSVIGAKISPATCPTADQFGLLAGHAGLVATEFSYGKDEEIYGEDEPAEYVYQVIQGAVRTYKLLSDGGVRSALFTCPATFSDWNLELATGWPRKPLLIPPCDW